MNKEEQDRRSANFSAFIERGKLWDAASNVRKMSAKSIGSLRILERLKNQDIKINVGEFSMNSRRLEFLYQAGFLNREEDNYGNYIYTSLPINKV